LDYQVKENQTMQVGACAFPSSLKGKYRDAFAVGQGATACVFIATTRSGNPVAIKVAKQAGRDAMWRAECSDMQNLRIEACAAGPQFQENAERYLPTCVEIGGHGDSAYYVMQAAGTTGIEDAAPRMLHDVEQQKNTFAQLVAAVYTLHGLGYTHNDLHGHNIVMDGPDLALIDFGEIAPHHRGLGYKHDVNSIWRWANALAQCGEASTFPLTMRNFFALGAIVQILLSHCLIFGSKYLFGDFTVSESYDNIEWYVDSIDQCGGYT